MDMDGKGNVWVLKPGHGSRGRGIKCYDSLKARAPRPAPRAPRGAAGRALRLCRRGP